MTDCCPTCGGVLPNISISVDLNLNVLIADGRVIKLRPQMAEILSVLCDRALKVVRRESMVALIYGGNEPDSAGTVIQVQIFHLRKKLADTAYEIDTIWGEGYRLIQKPNSPVQGAGG